MKTSIEIYTLNTLGLRHYELSNHLGNVLEVVTDRKLPVELGSTGTVDYFTADVISYNDYYPYGMTMPGRNYSGGDYRYGFNSKEKDSEVKGEGNSYDYGARMLDPRVARWLSIDPIIKEYESPYMAFSNSPIYIVDPNGADTNVYDAIGSTLSLPEGAVILETFHGLVQYFVNDEPLTLDLQGGGVRSFSYDGKTYTAKFNTQHHGFQGYSTEDGEKYKGDPVFDEHPFYYEDIYSPSKSVVWLCYSDLKYDETEYETDNTNTALMRAAVGVGVAQLKRLFGFSDFVSDALTAAVAAGSLTDISVQRKSAYHYTEAREWYGRVAFNVITGNGYIVCTGTSAPDLIHAGEARYIYQVMYKGKPIEGATWTDEIDGLTTPNKMDPPTMENKN